MLCNYICMARKVIIKVSWVIRVAESCTGVCVSVPVFAKFLLNRTYYRRAGYVLEQKWPSFHKASLAPYWGTSCNLEESLTCSGVRTVRNLSWCFFILVEVPAHSSKEKCWSCARHIATRRLTEVRHFSVFLNGRKEFSKF